MLWRKFSCSCLFYAFLLVFFCFSRFANIITELILYQHYYIINFNSVIHTCITTYHASFVSVSCL